MARDKQAIRSKRPPAESMNPLPLSPGVDTNYPTLENLDAQQQ